MNVENRSPSRCSLTYLGSLFTFFLECLRKGAIQLLHRGRKDADVLLHITKPSYGPGRLGAAITISHSSNEHQLDTVAIHRPRQGVPTPREAPFCLGQTVESEGSCLD